MIHVVGLVAFMALTVIEMPDAIEIERMALAERSRIERGTVEFEVERKLRDEKTDARYLVAFDGDRYRTDMIRSLPHRLSDGSESDESSIYRFVFSPKESLFYTDFGTDSGNSLAAEKRDLSTPEGKRIAQGDFVYRIDPRRIGIVPGSLGLLHVYSIEQFLARPDREGTSIQREEETGFWKIEYTRKDGGSVTLRIDPARGHSVIELARKTATDNGEPMVDRLVNEVKQYGEQEIWFPTTVDFSSTHGDKIVETAVYKITRAEFNTDIDPELFTLAGMDLPVGTMVNETPANQSGTRFWDGRALKLYSEMTDAGSKLPLSPKPAQSSRNLIILTNVFLLIAVALFLVWRRLRSTGA